MLLSGRAAHKLACFRHAAATGGLVAARQQQQQVNQPAFLARAVSDEAAVAGEAAPAGTGRVFARFNVYKGRGALSVAPMKPRWQNTAKGGWEVKKEGSMMFDIANSAGTRSYDWDNKIQVALNPLELAAIVAEPNKEHKFYHDTFKGSNLEGTKVKSFSWAPSDNGTAYFINVKLTDKTGGGEKVTTASVSLSPAEYHVLQQIINNTMHYHYGFDAYYLQTD